MARLVLRCRALERKNARLECELETLRAAKEPSRAGGKPRYKSDEERREAQRRAWREYYWRNREARIASVIEDRRNRKLRAAA